MPDRLRLKIIGLDRLKLKLALLSKKTRSGLSKALFREGIKIQVRAQEILTENNHIITGNLRRSIQTRPTVTPSEVTVTIGTNVIYAPKVEFLPDGGYLRPAFKEKSAQVVQGLENELNRVIRGLSR